MADDEIPPLRTCRKCGSEKPATPLFFQPHTNGLRHACRACQLAYAKAYREANPNKVRAAQRSSVAKNPDLYRQISKRWIEANRGKSQARLAKLYRENRPARLEAARKWRDANPERKRANDRAWRRANRKRMAENVAAWKAANPERWKAISRAVCARRRARKLAAPGSFNADDLASILKAQKHRCWWCNRKLTKYHADHLIPLARGGTNGRENIVASCPACNMKKGSKMPWEMDDPRLL